MKRPLDQLAEIAQKAVSIGNDLVRKTRPQTVTEKTDRDTYTDVDVRIERLIRAYLASETPELDFIGEEEGRNGRPVEGDSFWALDPIDGTANFVHGIPLCAIQLALIRRDAAIVAAVSLPHMGGVYWAQRGRGAFVNGEPIRVSSTSDISRAIVSIGDYATGERAYEKNKTRISVTAALADRVERVRMFGSAAHDLVWVAEGRTDATVILSNSPLDVQPGVLIAREAGACVVDVEGRDHTHASQSTVAVGPRLVNQMIGLLSDC